MNAIIPGAHPLFPQGHYAVAFQILDAPREIAGAELLRLISQNPFQLTGWPPFIASGNGPQRPYQNDGCIECWLGADGNGDPSHSDFWRASSRGAFFIVRGFQEDGPDMRPVIGEGRRGFDLTLPVWRLGEIFLYAASMAAKFGNAASRLTFQVEYVGLEGRELGSWGNRNRLVHRGSVSRQNSHRQTAQAQADQIDLTLPELVAQIVFPLYELFDFAQPPRALVAEELHRMRTRQL